MVKLRAALIGYGAMGKNHARILNSLDNVDLVAVLDPGISPSTSNLPFVSSLDDLIHLEPDYCVIATPTITHEEIAIKLAENGINIFIEKPIAISSDTATRIIASVEKNGLVGAVGHIERFNASLIEAKRRIKQGQLGDVYQISTRRLGPFPARVTDVGVTIDLATHDIDLTKWISDSTYESICAHSAIRSGRNNEDLISVVGKLRNGIITSHNVNWLSPLKERKTIITGEKGTFVADTLRSDLTFYENGSIVNTQREIAHFKGVTQGETTIFAFERPEALLVEHLEFINALNGLASNIVTLGEALETIRVAEAIATSAKEGLVIEL
ncbi:MAG: Gfo/Idh/MocA family oxidoreductase [Thermoleophilia bacterium]